MKYITKRINGPEDVLEVLQRPDFNQEIYNELVGLPEVPEDLYRLLKERSDIDPAIIKKIVQYGLIVEDEKGKPAGNGVLFNVLLINYSKFLDADISFRFLVSLGLTSVGNTRWIFGQNDKLSVSWTDGGYYNRYVLAEGYGSISPDELKSDPRSQFNYDLFQILKHVLENSERISPVYCATVLNSAAERGDLDIVKLMYSRFSDNPKHLISCLNFPLRTTHNTLHKAVSSGQTEVVKFLLNTPIAPELYLCEDLAHFKTPLDYAIDNYDPEMFRLLWEEGPGTDTLIRRKDGKGRTPLREVIKQAILKKDMRILKIILETKDDQNMLTDYRDYNNSTLLHDAIMFGGEEDIMQIILGTEKGKELLLVQDSKGRTPLHLAAEKGNVNLVKLFLKTEQGKQALFIQNSKGNTPLHVAAESSSLEVLNACLDGAQSNNASLAQIQNRSGCTALHCASEPAIYDRLIEVGGSSLASIKNNFFQIANNHQSKTHALAYVPYTRAGLLADKKLHERFSEPSISIPRICKDLNITPNGPEMLSLYAHGLKRYLENKSAHTNGTIETFDRLLGAFDEALKSGNQDNVEVLAGALLTAITEVQKNFKKNSYTYKAKSILKSDNPMETMPSQLMHAPATQYKREQKLTERTPLIQK